jgi:hypothetical protein
MPKTFWKESQFELLENIQSNVMTVAEVLFEIIYSNTGGMAKML